MNTAQTIFTLFYGLYFAATIPMSSMFRPFDTPAMYARDGRAWSRFAASFVLLNLAPLGYFVVVYGWLRPITRFDGGSDLTYGAMVVLLVLSIAGFGFWRVYFGIMLLKCCGRYVFYGDSLPQRLTEELTKRVERQSEFLPHFVPGVIWIVASLFLGYWWTRA